jgi:hypothetical protein
MDLIDPRCGITPEKGDDARALLERDRQPLGGIPVQDQIDGERFRRPRPDVSQQSAQGVRFAPGDREHAQSTRFADRGGERRGGDAADRRLHDR